MEPAIYIVIGVIVVATIAAIILYKKKISVCSDNINNKSLTDKHTVTSNDDLIQSKHKELAIKFEDIPALTESEESALVEIKDQKLLAKIDSAIPGTLQAIANASAINQYQQTVRNVGPLYQAIIPQGAKLVNAQDMDGAVRGFYRDAKGIHGHAHLIPVDGNSAQGLVAMNVANATMGVASMVVGQYYMTHINDQLEIINSELDKIALFQDKEYQSRIYALIAAVQKCSQFQYEIIENEEQRKLELIHLKNLEDECAKLLGQANLTIKGFEKKTGLDYSVYEKSVSEAQTWCQYQQVLLEIMLRIEELSYALNLGKISKDSCYSMFLPYVKQADEALKALKNWHDATGKALEIDLVANRRRRQGIEGFFMNIPAIFNDKLHYKDMSKRTVELISGQSTGQTASEIKNSADLFKEDVRLIAKDGKLYYLPELNASDEWQEF